VTGRSALAAFRVPVLSGAASTVFAARGASIRSASSATGTLPLLSQRRCQRSFRSQFADVLQILLFLLQSKQQENGASRGA
jgi:hypothetical protein